MGQSSDAVITLVEEHLDDLAQQAHRRLGDVAGVAVTLASSEGDPVTVGSSTTLARQVDLVQFQFGNGPCLNALRGGGGQYVPDLSSDHRWGGYGPAAAQLGARSCVSVPVERAGAVIAVVKVYSARADGLSLEQRLLATGLSSEVAGTLGLALSLTANAHELDDRTAAMNTRRVIDLAIGIVMERGQCTPDAAFATLRTQSQHTNTSLWEVAQSVVAPFGGPADASAPFSLARN